VGSHLKNTSLYVSFVCQDIHPYVVQKKFQYFESVVFESLVYIPTNPENQILNNYIIK